MSRPSQENARTHDEALQEDSISYRSTNPEVDLSLLQDSLAKTPWERMQANDDALNFAESLRIAMRNRRV